MVDFGEFQNILSLYEFYKKNNQLVDWKFWWKIGNKLVVCK